MSKYILLKVEDIEIKIKEICGNNKYVYDDIEYMKENYPEAYSLHRMLLTNKQIDLSGEAIKEKAMIYANSKYGKLTGILTPGYMVRNKWNNSFLDFKQAIKDILL